MSLLLLLLPPSCIVTPIGKSANKFSFFPNNFSTSTTVFNTKTPPSKPTMSSTNNIGLDILTGQFPNNESKVRGRNSFSPVNLSRESSVASSGCLMPYHKRMNVNMDLPSEKLQPEMSYETEQEKAIRVSMVANQQETTRPPYFMPNMSENPLIFNFLTIHTPSLNQSYGVVLSTPFLYTALSNTSSRMQKTSK